MTINVYSAPIETTSPKFAKAFRRGLPPGIASELFHDDIDRVGDHASFGSPAHWNALTSAIKRGGTWYYGDHAYFGRKQFYRITKNAFQHNGLDGKPDFNRLRRFHETAEPFHKTGRHVLICLQSEHFQERMGSPAGEYLHSLERRIRMYSDREIIVRDNKRSDIPFEHHLRDAWAVVTHSSACALHALMAGVPAFTTADNAVSSLTLRDPVNIERPFFPDAEMRMTVAARLAANQWSLDEIAGGEAWRKLNETI